MGMVPDTWHVSVTHHMSLLTELSSKQLAQFYTKQFSQFHTKQLPQFYTKQLPQFYTQQLTKGQIYIDQSSINILKRKAKNKEWLDPYLSIQIWCLGIAKGRGHQLSKYGLEYVAFPNLRVTGVGTCLLHLQVSKETFLSGSLKQKPLCPSG